MEAIASAIVPLVAIVAAGFLAKRFNVADAGMRKPLVDYCLYFGIPALVFLTVASASLPTRPPYEIWAAYLIAAAVCWLVASLATLLGPGSAIRSTASAAMAATYGNVLMLGIPVAILHFGPDASPTVAMIALVHSPVLFAIAAIHSAVISANRNAVVGCDTSAIGQSDASTAMRIGTLGRDLLTNPIIIAIVLAVLVNAGGVPVPPLVTRALKLLGQATLPCVLIAIGIGLASYRFSGGGNLVATIVILKLAALPTIAWWIGSTLVNLEPLPLAVVTFLSAMPVGANALAFAESNGDASGSISAAIAISTIACPLTLSVVLWSLAPI